MLTDEHSGYGPVSISQVSRASRTSPGGRIGFQRAVPLRGQRYSSLLLVILVVAVDNPDGWTRPVLTAVDGRLGRSRELQAVTEEELKAREPDHVLPSTVPVAPYLAEPLFSWAGRGCFLAPFSRCHRDPSLVSLEAAKGLQVCP